MKNIPINLLITLILSSVGALLTSCDVYDSEGDCSVHYKVPFTFTQNIHNVDAFSSHVSSVTLYVYDRDGKLALRKTESGEALRVAGYTMEVDLEPGHYSMLAWCEGTPTFNPATAFVIGSDDSGITGLSAILPVNESDEDGLFCDRDIVPLFHGYNADVELPFTYGEVILPAIDLMKDTNIFNISIENIDGTEISPDDISIHIETDNSEMNWDNTLNGNRAFRHTPWSVTPFSSIREDEDNMRADGEGETAHITGLLAELTTGRLMVNRKPILVIHRKNDNHDVRFDLVQLLCMVRGHYNGIFTDQEYLDRMDFHELTFFVDKNLNWYSAAGIRINGWTVVPPASVDV
ncbi:MAG: FimB/Mfa2 family fimbrial subunit [Muribaculaceae bacterium]|nr:FimB/Mfa2 family fimbrial subunit [Muribaculaceae bacterium]